MTLRSMIGLAILSSLSAQPIAGADFIALNASQWHPSAGTAVVLAAGEYEFTPLLNPDSSGLSAFFSGGGWNSWQWNICLWNSNDDSTHNVTDETRIVWFRTNNYGNPSGFDTGGAMQAFNAALAGDRHPVSTGYPGNGPYRFTIATGGTYYLGIFDSDQANNVGAIFADLHAVPAPGAIALLTMGGLGARRRKPSNR